MPPTDDDTGGALSVAEMVALLERRPDGQVAALRLAAVASDDRAEILAVERRPSSVQVAYHLLLCACGCGYSGDATVDLPLISLADLTPEGVLGVTVHMHQQGDAPEVIAAYEPPPDDLEMAARWVETRRLAFAGRAHAGEGDDNAQ